MAFSDAQVKILEAKLDAKHVRTRQVQDTTLAYVEGWHVIAEANRIFGYDAWDRHTLSTRCVWSGSATHHYGAAYIAESSHRGQGRLDRDHPRRLWEWERQGLNSGRSA